MSSIELNNGIIVGNYQKPYIVAEVNSSHNGNISIAKEMIKSAKECGCDCVKFQSWSKKSLYSIIHYKVNPLAERIVEKFSLTENDFLEIVDYCNQIGIAFSSTPYSKQEVDFLVDKCQVPFIKIASMEINNYGYLKYIAEKRIPVILSTGMSELEEIKKAVQIFEEVGNDKLILLHCVSIYPAPASSINLNNLITLKELFPKYAIGYSDHTIGAEIACASIALGSGFIEKHFTLDNKKIGMDNNMATEPKEMKELVDSCHNVFIAMGKFERIVSEDEFSQRKKMRRSIVSTKRLLKGTILTKEDLDSKRPGDGISVEKIDQLIGKTLAVDVEEDMLIFEKDIEF